jgi:predicted transcriptional regulator
MFPAMQKLVPLTVTVPPEVHEAVSTMAREQYLTRSAVVRRLLIEELERREQALAATAESEVAA